MGDTGRLDGGAAKTGARPASALHWLVGEAQLREHARHPGVACAKQSQRSAKHPVSVGVEGCERRRDHGSCAAGALYRVRERSQRLRGVEAYRWERHSSAYRLPDPATQRRTRALPALPVLQHPAPSRLRLGMGQLFGMVKQSQAN